jgi:hypothetical protein
VPDPMTELFEGAATPPTGRKSRRASARGVATATAAEAIAVAEPSTEHVDTLDNPFVEPDLPESPPAHEPAVEAAAARAATVAEVRDDVLQDAVALRSSLFLHPLTDLFYLIASREFGYPVSRAIQRKRAESPRFYTWCVWGDWVYRVVLVIVFIVVLLAIVWKVLQ